MKAMEILAALPSTAGPAVLFRFDALRQVANDEIFRAMFSLPESWSSGRDSHVVLTPAGPLLVDGADGRLSLAHDQTRPLTCRRGPGEDSLAKTYRDPLAALPKSEPDCLGVGRMAGKAPVALHVRIEGLVGTATAILAAEPPSDQLDLLHAVGVSYRGGEPCAGGFRARFHNRIDQHLLAGPPRRVPSHGSLQPVLPASSRTRRPARIRTA